MKHSTLSHLLVAAFICLPALAAAQVGKSPIRVREIYVPHQEFLERANKDPDGVIMDLDEYRNLVLKGIVVASRKEPSPKLPPVEAVVISAQHSGKLTGTTARFTSKLEIRVTRDHWVRCPLDPLPAALGRVLVDGKPGWIVLPKPVPQQKKGRAPVAFLLLKGKGVHNIELGFSLSATEKEDRWSIEGVFPRAESGRLLLDVPGYADATANPPHLQTTTLPGDQGSRFVLSLGSSAGFSIDWRLKRALGESDSMLSSLNGMTVIPRLDDPLFSWISRVAIQRRKTDILDFAEPEGAQVVTVTGKAVHSWKRLENGLRVLLNEPVMGEVRLKFAGILEGENLDDAQNRSRRYVIGPPRLLSAYSNSGYLAVCSITPENLQLEASAEATEVALSEGFFPSMDSRAKRCFSYTDEAMRLELTTRGRPRKFESRSAGLVRVLESGVALDSIYQVDMIHGSEYRFSLSLPQPWKLVHLETLAKAKGAAQRTLTWEITSAGDDRSVEIELLKAVNTGTPLVLSLRFEHLEFAPGIDWPQRELEFTVPQFMAAAKSRADIGVKLPDSMYAIVPDLQGWETMKTEALRKSGFTDFIEEDSDLVAGLTSTTEQEFSPIRLTLNHRRPMGEYQALTHLLALEGRIRVRNDLRLAIVDRAIDELRIRLPVGVNVQIPVRGKGIKEVSVEEADGDTSTRVIRYARPWTGTREIRLEYEVRRESLQEAGIGTRVPWMEITARAEDPLSALFAGDHGIVFQSLGAVKIEVEEGSELLNTDVDELPELGQPWSEGRVLFAYRFKARAGAELADGEKPASFRIHDFARADVLGIISREMGLTTVIDPGGRSRTRLNAVVAYNKDHQHLEIGLPEGAVLLSARVGGNPAPYVRQDEKTGLWKVPLPPLSYTQISLVYERSAGLGNWGTWTEEGPVFKGVPVIATRWRVFHPSGFRFHLDGGNLHLPPPTPSSPSLLPGSFLGLLRAAGTRGGLPEHGVLDIEDEARPFISDFGKIELERQAEQTGISGANASGNFQQEIIAGQNLVPQKRTGGRPGDGTAETMILSLQPEGHLIETVKLGGGAVLSLGYRDLGWWRFSKRTVFLLTLVLGIWLASRRGSRAFWSFSAGGLFLTATLSDIASRLLSWESPFLFIPACEGMTLLLACGMFWVSVKFTCVRLVRIRKTRAAVTAALVGALALLVFATATTLRAQEEVLIPYETETILGGGLGAAVKPINKVYIPYGKFRALWLLANPEMKKDASEAPADLVLGNGRYRLSIEKNTYRISGEVPLMILTDKWVTLPLPFKNSKLKEVLVDGKVIGVAQEKEIPFISLRGKGLRKLEMEFTGQVEDRLGSYTITARLLSGPAVHLQASLPAGAEPSSSGTPAGLTFQKTPNGTHVQIDLGSSPDFELGWTFPRIAGQQKARLESKSYSDFSLTLDGYEVHRTDVINVAGIPVNALKYIVIGDWSITSVTSPELSEWTVKEVDGARHLDLFYTKPVQKAVVLINGWSPLAGEEEKQAASLSLVDALHQESFIGIRHNVRRRWRTAILSNRRASINALDGYEAAAAGKAPDRLYQLFDSIQGQLVSASAATGVADAVTSAVFFVTATTNTLSARTRYQVLRVGPLRQEISLPPGWEFRNVQGATVGEWQVISTDEGPLLVVPLTQRSANGTQITWSAQRVYDSPQETIQVPLIRTRTMGPELRSESVQLTIAAAEELDVRVGAGSAGIEKVARTSRESWIKLPPPSRRLFDLRSTGNIPAYTLELEIGSRQGRVSARSVSFAQAEEDYILVNSQVTLSVTNGLEDTFHFRLPNGVSQTSLKTRNLKSLTTPDPAEPGLLRLTLTSGIVGQHAVALSYRLPRDRKDTPVVLRPLQILTSNRVLADTEYLVGVVETGQVLTNPKPQGLEKVRISDFPYLPEGVASESLHHAYRATLSNWSLTLDPETLRPTEGAQANIYLADLVTVIGSDGTIRTKAVYTIRNRKLQFLRIRLPEKTKLWGATLNGNPMIVSQNEGILQVPLKHVGLGDLNLEVGIVYDHEQKESLPSLSGSLDLGAPLVLGQGTGGEVTVHRTLWRVEVPDGYHAEMGGGGNMQEVVSSIQYASKVESNLGEIDQLTRYLEISDSIGVAGAPGKLNRRQREQANQSLKRLQQTLSDNVMDLQESNTREGQSSQTGRRQLQRDSLNKQKAESRQALDRGLEAQKKLEKAIKENEKKGSSIRSKNEQAFQDKYNFRGNDWLRQGRNIGPQQRRSSPGKAAPGQFDLSDLLYKTPFSGFRPTKEPRGETAIEKASAVAVTSPGLKPLPPSRVSQVNPALESPPAPPGATSLTFRRLAGQVRLELELSRKGLWLRFISPALLLLVLAGFFWRMGRKGKNS